MKPLKVYLQSPWKWTDSPYYKYLREMPPKDIEYVNAQDFKLIENRKRMEMNTSVKQFIKKIIRKLYPSMPNAHWTRNASRYDLIHCAHCLSKNKQPWVCDIEYMGQFWATGACGDLSSKKRILKILKRPYCKKILAWTEWARDGIIKEFPEIKNKIDVAYPAIPLPKIKKKKDDGKIRLLFVSRRFYFKGGLYALEVMGRLTKKYDNVEGILVSDVPEEVYEKYKGNKKIKFLGMVPQKKLFEEIYPSCNIFVYPSFTDTFGFAIIEAMSFGLPVVSVDGQSRKELIENGVSGFVVDLTEGFGFKLDKIENKKVLRDLEKKTEELIKDEKLRNKMSKKCRKVIKSGKFSIRERNGKMGKIYGEAGG